MNSLYSFLFMDYYDCVVEYLYIVVLEGGRTKLMLKYQKWFGFLGCVVLP